jgi:CRP-like cAMP-binding protein
MASASGGGGGGYESPSLHMLMRRSWEQPTQRDWAEVLGALPLFSRLRKRQLRRLAKLAKVADYSPAEVIVQSGERGDSFYLVLEGRANVLGKSRTLRAGDFFGEMALIDGGPRSATVTAATAVRTMQLPRRAFLQALEEDPRIALAIMESLAGRVRRLERDASA